MIRYLADSLASSLGLACPAQPRHKSEEMER